ncbi:hypothetical protein ACFLUG_01810 [Chloroflexota bacterium]
MNKKTRVFDLVEMAAYPYDEREKNVFFQTKEFKTRIIELPPDGQMPACEMESHVIFYVLSGQARVTVNSEFVVVKEKQCLITEPATISMKTEHGVRIVGIQIEKSHSQT